MKKSLNASAQKEAQAAKALAQLQQEHDSITVTSRASYDALTNERHSHHEKLVAVSAQLTAIQAQLANVTADKRVLRDERKSLEEKLEVEGNAKAALQIANKELAQKLADVQGELKNTRKERADLDRELETMTTDYEELDEEKDGLQEEFANLTTKYKVLKQKAKSAVEAKDQMAKLVDVVKTGDEERRCLQRTLGEGETREQELKEEVERLKSRLETVSKDFSKMTLEYTNRCRALQSKEDECAQLDTRNATLVTAVEELKKKSQAQAHSITQTTHHLTKLLDEAQHAKKERQNLQNKLALADETTRALGAEKLGLQQALNTAGAKNEELVEQMSSLTGDLRDSEKEQKRLRNEVIDLVNLINGMKAEQERAIASLKVHAEA